MSLMNTAGAVTTTIVPSEPLELVQPWQLGTGGVIATTNDPVQIAVTHILAVAFTAKTERVMRPDYGVGIQNLVFTTSPLAVFQQAVAELTEAYANYESTSFVTSVNVTPNPTDPSSYLFSVDFTLDGDITTHTALFDYTGNLVGTT